jgi:drug/metabolite transporter (DMT)-like permease
MSPYHQGMLLAAVGTICFSAKAVFVKLMYRYGADPISVLGLRMAFAFPMFAVLAWWVDRKGRPSYSARDWQAILLLGTVGYYLASFLDFLGLQYITAGLERIILYLNPTLVLLISVVWLKKSVSRRQWVALGMAYAGVLFVFWHDLKLEGGNLPLGAALVFGSAVSYAVYLVMAGEMVKRIGSLRLTAYATLVACALCVVQSLILKPSGMFIQAPEVYGISLVNSLFCTFVPVLFVMLAINKVGSSVTAQTGMLGPVSTIALAAWLLGEPITSTQLIGTAIVLAGVSILTIRSTPHGEEKHGKSNSN